MTSNPTVTVVSDGVIASSTTADGSGNYSFTNVEVAQNAPVTIYINDNGTPYGSLVTQASSSDLTGMDIYQDTVIARQTTGNAITLTDFRAYDSVDDTDIQFTASSTASELSIDSSSDFLIWSGTTFTAPTNFSVTGDYTNDGTFSANGGIFTFAGTAQQTATGTLSGASQFKLSPDPLDGHL